MSKSKSKPPAAVQAAAFETVFSPDPPHPLMGWDPITGEVVFTWRGLTPEQTAGVSAAILCQVQTTDVTWRSGWTFLNLLRNTAGQPVGLGEVSEQTAARVADLLGAYLPEELRLGGLQKGTAGQFTVEVESAADGSIKYGVSCANLAAALLATTTLLWGAGGAVRIEQYPENVVPRVVGEVWQEIRNREGRQ